MAEADISEFQELEGLLKCGICHERFHTPVITECAHTFCSLCIRKWLTTKAVCPACSVVTRESALRKNMIVENITEALERIKKKKKRLGVTRTPSKAVAQAASQGPSNSNVNPSNKLEKQIPNPSVPSSDSGTDDSDAFIPLSKNLGPSTSKASPKTNVRSNVPKKTSPRTPYVKPQTTSLNTSATPIVGASPAVIKVACPVCSVEMPQRVINEHLDKCLSGGATRSSVAAEAAVAPTPASAPTPRVVQRTSDRSNPPLEPIKKLVYNLMPDGQLRKELKKYGLPTQGDRKILAGRMQRYVVLHNAECDATNPRSLEELRKHFEKEERALSGPSNTSKFSSMFKTKTKPDEDEFDKARKEYIRQNDMSFQRLIAQCKNQTKPKTKEQSPQPVTLSDDEDNPEEVTVPANGKSTTDSDSDSPFNDVQKTPVNHKNIQRHVKRKVQCIVSESEDETDQYNQPEKRPSMEGNTSPVLVTKTPVRRELRSRVIHTKVEEKSKGQVKTKPKQVPKKGGTKAVVKKASPIKMVDSEGSDSLFDTPSSASSEIPCGQVSHSQREVSDDDALSQFVTLLDDDSGSSTDFEN